MSPLTDAQSRLALTCLPLAVKEAARINLPLDATREDAVSEAFVALCNAARLFDPTRGVMFSTYACWAVRRRLW